MKDSFNKDYWETRYVNDETGWDVGHISTPLKEYFDQLTDKELRILIPGAGNSYEAEYLHDQGFSNVHVIDLTPTPFKNLKERCPSFPAKHMIIGDFFDHEGSYDLIVEQTFFCALHPSLRSVYCIKVQELLCPNGKLVGLLFDDPLFSDHPPFGGNQAEYQQLFEAVFNIKVMKTANNSIAPRAGRELFIQLVPK